MTLENFVRRVKLQIPVQKTFVKHRPPDYHTGGQTKEPLMPSFDVVSEVDMHEVTNAVDQSNREVKTRFDFKGTNARFDLDKDIVTMHAPNDFFLRQMYDILTAKLTKRKVKIACLQLDDPVITLNAARQVVTVRQGINADLARNIVKMIKQEKLKVQAAIQGDKVRVSGKKRDDLQQIIGLLKEADIDMPLQYVNYRD
jgi:uncharacterized protein YajQ (UPF0234 family)